MRILVIDDQALVRKAVKKVLESVGYEVIRSKSGEEGIAKLQELESINLIILDIEMPKMNGFETYEKILELKKYSNIPVIFFTANDSLELRERGFELGAADFILKKFEGAELLGPINKILRPENRFQNMRALLVDDSPTLLKVVRKMLLTEGLNVITAKDGKEALNKYKIEQDSIDIIITDKEMPKMNGIELVRNVRMLDKGKVVPIIMVTSDTKRGSVVECFNSGVTDYINKPYIKEEFLARLYSLLENKLLSDQQQEYINKLQHLNLMKDKFLSVCSHDLRSPLSSILSFSEFLLDDDLKEGEVKEFAGYINSAGKTLMSFINDLLDLRKIENETEIVMESVNLNDVIYESRMGMAGMAKEKKINITFDSNDEIRDIDGDHLALTRVFNNILSNSIKFTPKGGMINIFTNYDKRKNIIIKILDNGIGIDKNKIDNVFDIFTKESKKGTDGEVGTGLGLSIVKTTVEKHGGEIHVVSDGKDKGTCFTLKFKAS